MKARAIARSNIALVKYWGKADARLNLPAVPSLSLTLDALTTTTTVEFAADRPSDRLVLDGSEAPANATARVTQLLDRVRAAAGITLHASVTSHNDFPTASGLASSASGFAALAAAACTAAGLDWNRAQWSDLARRSSASAARSIFGGFATLAAGSASSGIDDPASFLPAEPLLADALDGAESADAWDIRMVVAVATEGKKAIGSTDAMQRTSTTSPYYRAWVEAAPELFARARVAVLRRDLAALGEVTEASTMAMHACAMAASPAIVYLQPQTLLALSCVRDLREKGVACFATIDAGPHVKVLTAAADATRVERALGQVPGILRTIVARPGAAAQVEKLDEREMP